MNAVLFQLMLSCSWVLIGGLVCLYRNNNGLIDIFWGLGFSWISFWTLKDLPSIHMPALVLNAIVWVWSARLSGYLFLRNWNKPEDFRYADFRKGWKGSWVMNSILRVYLLQGVLLSAVAMSIPVLNRENPEQFSVLMIAGALIAVAGVIIEALADRQKSVFKSDPANAGRICDVGLWKRSRHPNYLGEVLLWWGMAFATIELPYGYLGALSAAFITFLLYKVSGVPFLEEKRKSDPAFRVYMEKTGAIFPKLVGLFAAVMLLGASGKPALASDLDKRGESKFALELNVLWPFAPFRTYEIKFITTLDKQNAFVVGYGSQNWYYTGTRHNEGQMRSHAFLIGARTYPFKGNNTSAEYTAWIAHDRFHHVNGQTYSGFSLAHEFYLGYQIYFSRQSRYYVHPQWNAGFWSHKWYTMPMDDRYVFDFLPKISVGKEGI